MFYLYPSRPVVKLFSAFVAILLSLNSVAQCPVGSISPVNNASYGTGKVLCVSGTFNQTVTINSGAELVITSTGNFTGTINVRSGAVVTVQAGGNFAPSGMNNFAGKIVNAGTTTMAGGTGIASGAVFENTGIMSFNAGFSYWGGSTQIKNLEGGTMYINQDFQLPSLGVLSNNGILYTKNLTVSSNTSFLNRGKAYIIGNLSLDGKLINDYLVVIKGTTSKQASDSLINYNMMVFDGDANFNGGVRNEGLFWFTSGQTKFHNGSLTQNNPNALTRVNSSSFYNNAAIRGTGGFYTDFIPVNSDGSIRGFNNSSTIMTNFSSSQVSNSAWNATANSNINGISSSSFPLFDTLNYVATWANPAAPFAQAAMLPILMGNFGATAQSSAVLVNWNTVSEVNGQYMVLQHSTNGSKFTDLYTVQSSGSTTSVNYQYNHVNPSAGTNYYRIMMVSVDNGIKYTGVVAVKIASVANTAESKVYPNPFYSQLQVKYAVSSRGNVSVRLISTEGKVVMNKVITGESTGSHTVSINTPAGLKPGVYIVEINTGDGITQHKLIKQ